jgi:hypothetical protein
MDTLATVKYFFNILYLQIHENSVYYPGNYFYDNCCI